MGFETGNGKCMTTVNYWDNIRREIKDILDGEYSEEGLQRLQGVLEECKKNITETFCYSAKGSLPSVEIEGALELLKSRKLNESDLWKKLRILLDGKYDYVKGPDEYGLFTVERFNKNLDTFIGKHSGSKEVIPLIYYSIEEMKGLEGVYKVRLINKKGGFDGLVDKETGEVILNPDKYNDIGEFNEIGGQSFAIVKVDKRKRSSCKFGLIYREKGGKIKVRIEPKYENLYYAGDCYYGFCDGSKERYVNCKTKYEHPWNDTKAIRSKMERNKRITEKRKGINKCK